MFATAKIGAVLVTINTNYKSMSWNTWSSNPTCILAIVDGLRDMLHDVLYELVPELKTMARELSRANGSPASRTSSGAKRAECIPDGTLPIGRLSVRRNCQGKEASTTTTWSICSTRQAQPAPERRCSRTETSLTTDTTSGSARYYQGRSGLRTCPPVHCFARSGIGDLTHGATAVMVEQFEPLIVLASVKRQRQPRYTASDHVHRGIDTPDV